MIFRIIICISLPVLFFAEIVCAQNSYDQLRSQVVERQNTTRSQIDDIRSQIETYMERLGQTTEQYDEMFRQYEELTRLIALQQEQLRKMNQEQRQIGEEIRLIENNLSELERRLTELIRQYEKTLTYLYKHGRTTELALLLTSTSMNQLAVRSYYLGKFDQHRREQMDEIEDTKVQLEESKKDLEQARQRNQTVLVSIREEARNLEQKQDQQKRRVDVLQQDKANIQKQIDTREQQLADLNSILANLAREEERIREAEARNEGVVVRESGVSSEELLVFQGMFEQSRGQLPWPVNNGTITQRFGVRVHPVFNTRTNFPGVEIAAIPQSTVRVVNDGYVIGIEHLPGFGDVIFVHHGKYKTAYGNMSDIFVRKNQVLRRGDTIGLSGDENSLNGEVLIFLIAEGSQYINPENWLQRAVP